MKKGPKIPFYFFYFFKNILVWAQSVTDSYSRPQTRESVKSMKKCSSTSLLSTSLDSPHPYQRRVFSTYVVVNAVEEHVDQKGRGAIWKTRLGIVIVSICKKTLDQASFDVTPRKYCMCFRNLVYSVKQKWSPPPNYNSSNNKKKTLGIPWSDDFGADVQHCW